MTVVVDWWSFGLMRVVLLLPRRLAAPTSPHRTAVDREIAVAVVMSQRLAARAAVTLVRLAMIAARRTDNLAVVAAARLQGLIEKRRAAHIAVRLTCIAVDQAGNFLILPSTVVDHIHYMAL